MKTLKFAIEINAPGNVVWNTLTNTEIYELWVKAFSANSYLECQWKQGGCNYLDPDIGGTKAVI